MVAKWCVKKFLASMLQSGSKLKLAQHCSFVTVVLLGLVATASNMTIPTLEHAHKLTP